ncbi:MFS transporter [bacterium]|nr:ABC transporter ATP-binding protein [Chloroflexi bacterium CFX6]RIL09542.1 MAG: MFS transporter [bacterium]
MVEVDRLTRYYGPVPAINDVSFRAYRGEIVGFLGPNGAGKTTTMRMLTGYLPPSSGTARIAGHDIVSDSMAARRVIGYLPESTPLYTDMTVFAYLRFMARLRHVPDAAEAAERVMRRVSIDHRADDLIGQLSKGLKQRVGIAQALVHDPALIILDEPTIGLDPRQILEVRGLIRELRGDHTIILSTHILPEAQQVCDRVLIINRGRIVAEDETQNLTARLQGGPRIRVAVPADLDAATVSAALSAVAGVDTVAAAGDGVYAVTAVAGANPSPDLAETVVGRGWPLMELTPVSATLEDIFLELTAEEPAPIGDDTADDTTDMEEEHA